MQGEWENYTLQGQYSSLQHYKIEDYAKNENEKLKLYFNPVNQWVIRVQTALEKSSENAISNEILEDMWTNTSGLFITGITEYNIKIQAEKDAEQNREIRNGPPKWDRDPSAR